MLPVALIFTLLSLPFQASSYEKIEIGQRSYWQQQIGSEIYLTPTSKKFELVLRHQPEQTFNCQKIFEFVDALMPTVERVCFKTQKCSFISHIKEVIGGKISHFTYSIQPNLEVLFEISEVNEKIPGSHQTFSPNVHLTKIDNLFDEGIYQIKSSAGSRISRLETYTHLGDLFKGEVMKEGRLLKTKDRLSACEMMAGNAWISASQEIDTYVYRSHDDIQAFDEFLDKLDLTNYPFYLQGAMIGWEAGKFVANHAKFRYFLNKNRFEINWIIKNFYQVDEDTFFKRDLKMINLSNDFFPTVDLIGIGKKV